MSVVLLVTAGNGPAECRQAVGHLLGRLSEDAQARGLSLDCAMRDAAHGPSSAIVQIEGAGAEAFADGWAGVVLWRCASALRPRTKRKRWFVGIIRMDAPTVAATVDPGAVSFQAMRAGGPGGQHQNTTDSAVRARWQAPDGTAYTVVARDARSQHMNRKVALARLNALVAAEQAERGAQAKGAAHAIHQQLERGNPRHVFDGPTFRPVK